MNIDNCKCQQEIMTSTLDCNGSLVGLCCMAGFCITPFMFPNVGNLLSDIFIGSVGGVIGTITGLGLEKNIKTRVVTVKKIRHLCTKHPARHDLFKNKQA